MGHRRRQPTQANAADTLSSFGSSRESGLTSAAASAAVPALRNRLQISARVLRDRIWNALPAGDLVCGDVIRVRTGDFVPAGAQIIDGTLQVDQSALTGESRELEKAADDPLYSGSIAKQGEATAVVTSTGVGTFYGRTTRLVESARPKLHVEEVVTRVPVMFTVSMAVGSVELARHGVLVTRLSAAEDATRSNGARGSSGVKPRSCGTYPPRKL